jgi:hypothetical protein
VAAADGVPAGYRSSPGDDCNDQDASIVPGMPDILFDGVDANCDGNDGAFQCGSLQDPEACECGPDLPCQLPPTTCSDQSDLAIVAVDNLVVCVPGSVAVTIRVANVGGAPFAGSVVMRYAGLTTGESPALGLQLAPGETRLVEVDPGFDSVELATVSGDDCRLDNNTAQVPPWDVNCE